MVAVLLVAAPLLLLPAAAHADSVATVTSPDGVNVRSGPGTTFPVLAIAPFGTALTVTGDAAAGNWLPVNYGGVAGYVLGEYVSVAAPTPATGVAFSAPGGQGGPTPPQPAPAATPTPVPATPPAAAAVAQFATVVPPDGLNLRSGPGTSYPVVVAVPGGARLQIAGRPNADGWYSVVYGDRAGWVLGSYLSFTAMTPTPAPTATTAAPPGTARFAWPVESRRISTPFSVAHPGIDIDEFPNGGNPVSAGAAGTVTFAGGSACCSYGLYVIVKHADGYTSLYAHLSSVAVSEGQEVRQGALLGKSGNTGYSTGAHLHFEIRKDGVAVDPLTLLSGAYSME